jgi:hypothetical protein
VCSGRVRTSAARGNDFLKPQRVQGLAMPVEGGAKVDPAETVRSVVGAASTVVHEKKSCRRPKPD